MVLGEEDNLHRVVGVLQTEGDVVEVFVGDGALRHGEHVVLVGRGAPWRVREE